MAFSFASVAAEAGMMNGSTQGGVKAQDGEELQEIQTDELGFIGVNGEAKVRLLTTPWPQDEPPIPTSNLLSVASSQGLLAAAGPDSLVIVSTESVRNSLGQKQEDNIRDISPQTTISHSRLAHIAFSADESVLVVSEQFAGGLTVYEVDKLKSGQTEPSLQIPTNNTGLRVVVPNPVPESAQYFAAVTDGGELLLADLGAAELKSGIEGTVLAKNVTSLSWSNRGKQLVAGKSDGSAVQLKPDGTVVAHIPKSTSVSDNVHISEITWLENDSFFVIYTPNGTSTDDGIPPSEYYIVSREPKTSNFTFRKLPEILVPFGLERLPTSHFILRLRGFPPHIQDILVLSSTTSTDVGIISKADKALDSNLPLTDVFTMTSIADDTRRAALPLSPESALDTSPIGMALDLSSKQNIINPIPSDPEIQESSGPAPNILVLNNEGILCSWWLVYNDSIRQKTTFSGFSSLGNMEKVRQAASPPPDSSLASPLSTAPTTANNTPALPTSAFNQSITSNTSSFAQPKASVFAQPSLSTGTAFGTSFKSSESKNSWTSTGFSTNNSSQTTSSAFEQPSFGTPPTFGTAPAFGQSGFGAKPVSSSPFGAGPSKSPFSAAGGSSNTSGFASFANTGGFGSGPKTSGNESPFSKPASQSPFGQQTSTTSPFAAKTGNASFFQQSSSNTFETKSQGFSGFGSTSNNNKAFNAGTSFKLDSSFKGDGSAKDDLPAPAGGVGSTFGSGLDELLVGGMPKISSPVPDNEAEMDDDEDQSVEEMSADEKDPPFSGFSPTQSKDTDTSTKSLVTPPSTISQSKTTPAPSVSGLFGSTQQTTTPVGSFTAKPMGWGFGNMSTTPKDTPAPSKTVFGTRPIVEPTPAMVQKSEPVKTFTFGEDSKTPTKSDEGSKITTESPSDNETVNITKIPEAPLPPDPTSKPGYVTGDTSSSSANSKEPEDAPLPPDFLFANKSATKEAPAPELPLDDGDDEFSSNFDEDSAEDLTQDISQVNAHNEEQDDSISEQVQTSPESSFKGDTASIASPTGGLFTKVSAGQVAPKPSRPLFGEVGTSGPIFPPPKPQESPRSPSPVRNLVAHDHLRPDSRSFSAPAQPRSAIDQRKVEYSQSAIASQAARAREDEAAKERARLDAMHQAKEMLRAQELQSLEDDEDERIQRELGQPIAPSETLDAFITYQTGSTTESVKADIPAQIERLYQDINSMVYTLGINARSLSSFLMYQKGQEPNHTWPDVLQSDTPMDALNDEWFLNDIVRLHEGSTALEQSVETSQVENVTGKLEQCQSLLTKDLFDLRTKVISLRKSIHARASGSGPTAPLSAEQASIQHDLRKASAAAQMKLVQVEDNLTVLRARLAEAVPTSSVNGQRGAMGSPSTQKKPTVEAVTNTVAKMTIMAEKKSADIDVLEAQLKKLDAALGSQSSAPGTPYRGRASRSAGGTPGSAGSSVYHTPGSKVGNSARSTPFTNGSKTGVISAVISTEDRERWQGKARRKKEVASVLRRVLEEKRQKAMTLA